MGERCGRQQQGGGDHRDERGQCGYWQWAAKGETARGGRRAGKRQAQRRRQANCSDDGGHDERKQAVVSRAHSGKEMMTSMGENMKRMMSEMSEMRSAQ